MPPENRLRVCREFIRLEFHRDSVEDREADARVELPAHLVKSRVPGAGRRMATLAKRARNTAAAPRTAYGN
jgi:hypothetical protein